MYLVRIIFHPEGDGFKEFYFSREYLSISLSPRSLPAKEGGELEKETNWLPASPHSPWRGQPGNEATFQFELSLHIISSDCWFFSLLHFTSHD